MDEQGIAKLRRIRRLRNFIDAWEVPGWLKFSVTSYPAEGRVAVEMSAHGVRGQHLDVPFRSTKHARESLDRMAAHLRDFVERFRDNACLCDHCIRAAEEMAAREPRPPEPELVVSGMLAHRLATADLAFQRAIARVWSRKLMEPPKCRET